MCIGAVLLSTGCNQSMSYAVKELVIRGLAVSAGLFSAVQTSTPSLRVPAFLVTRNILSVQLATTVQGSMPTSPGSTNVLLHRTYCGRVSRTGSLLSMKKFGIVVLRVLAVK